MCTESSSVHNADLLQELKSGNKYLIDRYLNTKFLCTSMKWHCLHFVSNGRHSLVVHHSKVLDSAFCQGEEMPLDVLHLKKSKGVPNKKKGILKHINVVYCIFNCVGNCKNSGCCELM